MLETKENSVSIPAPKEVVASLQHVYTGVFDPNIDAAMIELAHTCKIWQFAGKWWTTWPPQMFVPRDRLRNNPHDLAIAIAAIWLLLEARKCLPMCLNRSEAE